MRNLGSAIIFIVLMVLGNILFLILKAIGKFTKRFERIKDKLGSSLYWGSTTRFILQQFTPIVLSSTITLLDFNTEHFFDSFGIFLAIALLFITAFSLISFTYQLYKRDKDEPFSSLKFDIAFKPLIEGINLSSFGKYWNIVVLIRWVITIFVLIFLRDHPAFQLQSLIIVSILVQMMVSIYKPLEEPIDNTISVANEFMVTAYLYFLIGLTDIVPDNQHREELGFALLSTVFICTLFNVLKVFYVIGKMGYQSWRIRSLKKLQKQRIEQSLKLKGKQEAPKPIAFLDLRRASTELPHQFDGEATTAAQFSSVPAIIKPSQQMPRITTILKPRARPEQIENQVNLDHRRPQKGSRISVFQIRRLQAEIQ
ncbi:hypothetical protein FGO68_gene17674 [Halteria grandinella]|uniref:TRP C-terminal domain-containing protein n=1 Tax=Halteria grandinella TaxID=5974 RepID=A0A8J8P4V1_HALGN|nr:hypothetical protein FGO68_gene17674 [Halteria grandinella]